MNTATKQALPSVEPDAISRDIGNGIDGRALCLSPSTRRAVIKAIELAVDEWHKWHDTCRQGRPLGHSDVHAHYPGHCPAQPVVNPVHLWRALTTPPLESATTTVDALAPSPSSQISSATTSATKLFDSTHTQAKFEQVFRHAIKAARRDEHHRLRQQNTALDLPEGPLLIETWHVLEGLQQSEVNLSDIAQTCRLRHPGCLPSPAEPGEGVTEGLTVPPQPTGAKEPCRHHKFVTGRLLGRETVCARIMAERLRQCPRPMVIIGSPGVGKTAVLHWIEHTTIFGDKTPGNEASGNEVPGGEAAVATSRALPCRWLSRRSATESANLDTSTHTDQGAHDAMMTTLFDGLEQVGQEAEGEAMASNLDMLIRSGQWLVTTSTPLAWSRFKSRYYDLARKFVEIELPEPTDASACDWIADGGAACRLTQHHGLTLSRRVIQTAVSLCQSARRDAKSPHRALPGGAVDLLDSMAANWRQYHQSAGSWHDDIAIQALQGCLQSNGKTSRRVQDGALGFRLNPAIMPVMIDPPESAQSVDNECQKSPDTSVVIGQMVDDLTQAVCGQDQAITQIGRRLALVACGLNAPDKPKASWLFSGPSGVGKTSLAKHLAHQLNCPLLHYDLSEFSQPHTVARLVGAPPGYTGYGRGGELTQAIEQTPRAVVLFDEIEKAHIDVQMLALQILDNGRLTDMEGRPVCFRQAWIIATTNAGSHGAVRNAPGFTTDLNNTAACNRHDRLMSTLMEVFPVEWLNRFDSIVAFQPLDEGAGQKIIRSQLECLNRRTGGNLVWSERLIDCLARMGISRTDGARRLLRVIDERVASVLADWLMTENGRRFTSSDQTPHHSRVFLDWDKHAQQVRLSVVQADPVA